MTEERCRRRDVANQNHSRLPTIDSSRRRFICVNNLTPSFYINGATQVTDDYQPITAAEPDQTAFAIDDDLEPTADDERQTQRERSR